MALHIHAEKGFKLYPSEGAILIHTHKYTYLGHVHYLDAWDSNDDFDSSSCMTFGPGVEIPQETS